MLPPGGFDPSFKIKIAGIKTVEVSIPHFCTFGTQEECLKYYPHKFCDITLKTKKVREERLFFLVSAEPPPE